MATPRSEPECPSGLNCGDSVHCPCVDFVQSLLRNSSVFPVDHRFELFDEFGRDDRCSTLMLATPGDEGYFSTERSTINRIGKMIPRTTD